jgi:hypothetical protein
MLASPPQLCLVLFSLAGCSESPQKGHAYASACWFPGSCGGRELAEQDVQNVHLSMDRARSMTHA